VRYATQAQVDGVAAAIKHRLNYTGMMVDLMSRHAPSAILAEIEAVAGFHAGAEEIGSSDVSHMVDSVVRGLGEPSIFED
jgi:hypothetical protein